MPVPIQVPATSHPPRGIVAHVHEVRRPYDDELCGFVDHDDGHWRALTVFGGLLGRHTDRDAAIRQVLDDGLASLADRWVLRRRGSDEDEVVCIVEANPREVTLALDYYSLPGVPTITIRTSQVASGEFDLRR
jgi:hypothetical protein